MACIVLTSIPQMVIELPFILLKINIKMHKMRKMWTKSTLKEFFTLWQYQNTDNVDKINFKRDLKEIITISNVDKKILTLLLLKMWTMRTK